MNEDYAKKESQGRPRPECGQLGSDKAMGLTGRQSLTDRIASQRLRASTQARAAEQLGELEYLLNKNPEVARILDLMEVAREQY